MANGLGIAGLLKHSSDDSARGKWIRQWNKNNVGDLTFWIHTRATIVPCFGHPFMLEDEYVDKETKQKVPILRFLRFNSPDSEVVHRSQYFREDDDTLKVKPDRDPFLLLREYLRFANHIAMDQVVFQWYDTKKHQTHAWERGLISGLVKPGKATFSHTLSTKLEYVFVVVDNDHIKDGPVLARFGKLPTQRITEVIAQQQKIWGEEDGDPQRKPYAFHMVAKETKSPMDMYDCFKDEKLELSDEVWALIASEEFPDPVPHGMLGDGDMQKIRDAMEAAAKIELPFDKIFSEDPDVRRSLCRPQAAQVAPARSSKRSAAEPPPPASTAPANGTGKPLPPKPGAATKPAATGAAPAAAPAGTGTVQRRKKTEAPPPPVDMIPCDDCQKPMPATAPKCANCGAEYDVGEATPAPAASATKSKPAANGAPPASTAAAATSGAETPDDTCWACAAVLNSQSVCPSCGVDQADDVPFITCETFHELRGGIGERWNITRKLPPLF